MTTKAYYPAINLGSIASLAALRQQMDLHPDYLTDEGCPYDQSTRDQLERILAPRVVEVEKVVEVERVVEKRVEVQVAASEGGGKRGPKPKATGVDIDAVAKEIDELRQELRQMKIDAKGMQVNDRIALAKVRAALVEKLLNMSDRAVDVKKRSLFLSTVMSILDDLMPDDMRQEFMKRLEPFAAAE